MARSIWPVLAVTMSDYRATSAAGSGEVVPLWRMTVEQQRFSSWTSGYGADDNNGSNADFGDFTARDTTEQAIPSDNLDEDIFSVAYKKGWEDGQAASAEEAGSSNQHGDALAEAIQHLNNLSSPDSFAFILTAVESLFRRCAELARPDPDMLQAWALQLAELVDQDQKGVALVLHPDDLGLIDRTICKLPLRGDESMLRGNLKLSHSGGWIEKGSEVVLDELRTLIDEFSGKSPATNHD